VSKSLETQLNQKQHNTIILSKAIISGTAKLAPLEMNITFEQTLDEPTTKKVFSGENAVIGFGVVKVLVNRFIDSFGFSTKLSETQLEILAIDTIENFKYESLQDVILFFKMARSGKLGTTKRGVDSNLIFGEWFPMYLELKSQKREEEYQKNKSNRLKSTLTIENVVENHKKLIEKPFYVKVSEWVDKITDGITREKLEEIIQEWENDPEKKKHIQLIKKKRRTIK
jgi:hypothetical protein